MKRCPSCGTTYTDETLRFCLADGAVLDQLPASASSIFNRSGNKVHVDVPGDDPIRTFPSTPLARSSRGPWLKILLALIVAGFLGLIVVGAAGVFLYYNTPRDDRRDVATNHATPEPSPTRASGRERDTLQDTLANLQRQLEEGQTNSGTNTNPFSGNVEARPAKTATVNSPNDGFLALRSIPDTELGIRLVRIPHGAKVEVQTCAQVDVRIGERTGRWCVVKYKGLVGWVFDAWLDY